MTTPLARYQQDLQQPGFIADEAQANAVQYTQRLFDTLQNRPTAPAWWKFWEKPAELPRGLYFWGGVGRGKTYLVDNFYATLPFEEKQRIHFHRFMREVHEQLKDFRQQTDPLPKIVQQLAQNTQVLCLDEFHVSDITDAMILSGLLKAIFDAGIVLVITSNSPPDTLYKGGLQRERFLPAIALLQQSLDIVQVDAGTDYRLRALEQASVYYHPLDKVAEQAMYDSFMRLSPDQGKPEGSLFINGREIPTLYEGDGIVWLDFQVLCNIPRAVDDYIELAKCYNTVLLSNVPQMNAELDDFARRLINLVDEFYDRNVKLIISAATIPEDLYHGYSQAFAFQRTVSRLQEMQSHEYLERPHKP